MFIGGRRNHGHPPSGGPCQSLKTRDALYNMSLLPEGGRASRHRFYKHGPPGGGRAPLVTASINMALPPEGEHLTKVNETSHTVHL